jgi:outer membrane protein TolC
MGYPMVGLGLNYSLINSNPMASSSMNGKDMIMPMVTVTLPVFRKKYNAMKTETDFMKTAAEHGIRETGNALQVEFAEALQGYRDAERRTVLYRQQYQLASQSLNILVKSFSASGTGLTDLLRVRQQVLDFGLKQSNAVADYNSAVARLEKLIAVPESQPSGGSN